MPKPNLNQSQNGNAIMIILVAVALFAALSFVFSNTSRNSSRFVTDAEADAYANQIIAYGNEVRQAVKRLTLRGCSDTEISFENIISTVDYSNSNAPSDQSCHVFGTKGGGVQYQTASSLSSEPNFIGNIVITGHGTDCAGANCSDLFIGMRLSDVTSTPSEQQKAILICQKINKILGHSDTLETAVFGDDTDGGVANWKFDGFYRYTKTVNEAEINGKKNYCASGNAGLRTYHQILISR